MMLITVAARLEAAEEALSRAIEDLRLAAASAGRGPTGGAIRSLASDAASVHRRTGYVTNTVRAMAAETTDGPEAA